MKRLVLTWCLILWVVLTRPGFAAGSDCISLAPGSLIEVLHQYSERTDQQIMVDQRLVKDKVSRGAAGCFSPAEVLERLLEPHSLSSSTNDNVVVIAGARIEHPVEIEVATAPEPAGVGELDEIVVHGHSLRNTRSITAKRNNRVEIAEYIAKDDFGQLPDFNIADSARRAVGVFSVFDEDEGRR